MPKTILTPDKLDELWDLYRSRRWTQAALAVRYKVSQGYVSKIVNGHARVGYRAPAFKDSRSSVGVESAENHKGANHIMRGDIEEDWKKW